MTTGKVSIDRESMAVPSWRNKTRQHIEALAARLVTRGDLLRLAAETTRDLDAWGLAGEIGRAAYDEDRARNGAKTTADFLRKAAAMLDAGRDHAEELNLTVRQRAEIVYTFGPLAWRLDK